MDHRFIKDSKTRKKVFDNRSSTLLKLTNELSTLCDTPACIVIHNPNDVIRPWRIWPENEAALRSMIEIYKTSSNNANGSQGFNRAVSDVGFNGGNNELMSVGQVNDVVADLDRKIAELQKKIDSKGGKTIKRSDDGNQMVRVAEEDSAVLGMGSDEYANQSIAEQPADNVVSTATTTNTTTGDDEIGGFIFDGQLWDSNEGFDVGEIMSLCESGKDNNGGDAETVSFDDQLWKDNEIFDLDEFLNGRGEDKNTVEPETDPFWDDLFESEEEDENTEELEPEVVPVVGSKRKAVEELMPPSSQRLKVDM